MECRMEGAPPLPGAGEQGPGEAHGGGDRPSAGGTPKGKPAARSSPRAGGLAALKAARRAELASRAVEEVAADTRAGGARGRTGLYTSTDMLLHRCTWDSAHIESPARLRRVVARCQELGLVARCLELPPREAKDRELLAYHDQAFLDTMASSREQPEGEAEAVCRGLDSVYLCPDTDRSARLAAGGAVDLVQEVLAGRIHNGMGLVRPPGHHAMAATPCGFCGFNNAVVAAQAALDSGTTRVLIVDFDLHHGQGTQQAFYSDPRVLYMSVHRYEQGAYWPHLR